MAVALRLVRGLGACLQTIAAIIAAGFQPAWAGAFNLPQGDGLLITDVTFSGGSRYFDGKGRMAPADDFSRGDLSAYLEYGVTDWLMAIVRPDLTEVSLSGSPRSRYIGPGTSDIGAQLRLLVFGPAVFAVSGSFRIPGSTDTRNRALLGNTTHEAEVRGLFGLGFTVGPWPAFLDAQLAYRARDSGAPDEVHTDLTIGLRPRSDLQVLVQLFDIHSVGRGTPWFPHKSYTQLELAGVYDLTAAWSLQLGVYTTVLGRRSLREQGVQTAVWYRF